MSNRQRLKCRWPKKDKYPSRAYAYAALLRLNAQGKTGLSPYQCPVGHWHLGRWKK